VGPLDRTQPIFQFYLVITLLVLQLHAIHTLNVVGAVGQPYMALMCARVWDGMGAVKL
jgi:hypothetical protein